MGNITFTHGQHKDKIQPEILQEAAMSNTCTILPKSSILAPVKPKNYFSIQCSPISEIALLFERFPRLRPFVLLKADSHIACRAHAVPLSCRGAKGLECVFPIWFTQCGRVWVTLAMPRPCHALTMPFFSRPRHSTAVERRPVGYLPTFGFFRLPRALSRRLLSEAYHSPSQRSIPTTVNSGSSTLQKKTIC
jgi:hypothetical protein